MVLRRTDRPSGREALSVRVSHRFTAGSARFDEDNLVSDAGLVPLLGLAEQTGLAEIIAEKVSIKTSRIKSGAANPAPKLVDVIAGMCASADSIDDLDVLRAGGVPILFDGVYAPSTLGDAVAGVQLRARPPAGVGAPRAPGRPGRTHRAAGRDRRAGVHRHRLAAAPGLRARQAGRLLRTHQDRRQAGTAQGTLAAGHHDQHAAQRAGDRRDAATRG